MGTDFLAPHRELLQLLKANIRVQCNWRRLMASGPKFSFHVERRSTALERWYSPWYFDERGKEIRYDHPKARLTKTLDAYDVMKPGSSRRKKIDKLRSSYLKDESPPSFLVVLYRGWTFGKRPKHLVLDGNHRSVARLHPPFSSSFLLPCITVIGPLDSRIIPDLANF